LIKSKIRKKILQIRKKKNNKNIKLPFLKIFKEIEINNFKNKIVGGYYPVNFEIDILEFLEKLELKGIKLSLPVIKKNKEMDFYNWSNKNLLKLNKYGIPEPEKKKKIYPDILMIPIVAFDKKLYRIGYGGGYYDRYIEKNFKKKKVFKVGIAHSCQKKKKVPTNQHDEKLGYYL
jgi:5,10-methenyltetrahydrofolate synthetase